MKIAIITDIHFDGAAPGAFDVRSVVAEFVAWANAQGADLLVDLGDRIDDIDRRADLDNAGELASIFARFSGPRIHLLGNHDVVNLTAKDHDRLFGRLPGHKVIDLGDMRLLVWEPSVLLDRKIGFPPTRADQDWLLDALISDLRPAIIVSHIPVSGAAMTGNFYFENNADFATYPDHAEVRHAVERTGRAAIWISGHVHWNSLHTSSNLRHLTVQSASETYTTLPGAACSYAMLEIAGTTVRLDVLGRDPLRLEFPWAATLANPWPTPRPRVAR